MLNYLFLYSLLSLIFPSKKSEDIIIEIDIDVECDEIVEIEEN